MNSPRRARSFVQKSRIDGADQRRRHEGTGDLGAVERQDQSGRGAASKQSASIPAPAAAPRRPAQTCLPFIFSALIARSSGHQILRVR